jgi:hypothetical protein
MNTKIIDFEIVDHGIENEQYFQGCGVAMTCFDECFTGIGNNLKDAIDDALNQISENGFDLSLACTLVDECASLDSASSVNENSEEEHYYASIRLKVKK